MPKLAPPGYVGEHDGGAASDGEMAAVTACGIGTGAGMAWTAAARARAASVYCILMCSEVIMIKI